MGSDTDLKELKDLINKRFDSLEERMKEFEIGQAKIGTRLDEWKNSISKISDLAEKVEELKNWKQIAIFLLERIVVKIDRSFSLECFFKT